MKTSWTLALALMLALPVYAQEEVQVVPADEYAAEPAFEEAAPDEAAPVEEFAAEEAPFEETAAEEAPFEEAAAEEAVAEETPAEPSEPLELYAGLDYVVTTVSLSNTGATGASDFDSGMYRGRIGVRALEAVGIELHYGVDNSDEEPGAVETESYIGLFVVPTATVFEVVELAFPVGYAQSSFGQGGASEDYGSIAYGLDGELPLRSFSTDLPDLRLSAGWMIYYQKSDARAYGANLGLRYDFKAAGFGNPFAGFGGWVGGLWPFGGDDEVPAE